MTARYVKGDRTEAAIALGSNLGDREASLRSAVAALMRFRTPTCVA